jgi:hypothetical protein
LIYLLVASGHDAGDILGRTAIVIGFQAFVIMFALLLIAAGGGGGGGEPGSDDDGPGWRRPEPRRPPPEPHVSWPDFERQFAEHVEARRTRDKVPAG